MSMNPCPPAAVTAEPTKKQALRPEDVVRADDLVKALQTPLGVHATGVFASATSRKTYEHVTKFQAANNLPVNGEFNAKTAEAMLASPNAKNVEIAQALTALQENNLLPRLYQPRLLQAAAVAQASLKTVDCFVATATPSPTATVTSQGVASFASLDLAKLALAKMAVVGRQEIEKATPVSAPLPARAPQPAAARSSAGAFTI